MECFFSTTDHIKYYWSGCFETIKTTISFDSDSELENNVKIIYETLKCNDMTVVERDQEKGIIFKGQKTPKLSPFESVLELFDQEDDIIPIKRELNHIILADSDRAFDKIWRLPVSVFKKHESSSLIDLKDSGLPLPIKLSIVYRIFPEELTAIKKTFSDIFPNVVDIKIENLKIDEIPVALSEVLKEANLVSIKERGVENWIENISSGMFKTLMYISELYLSPDNCVFLIDEFENSLGVNCLDSVTDLILRNRTSQFIITSHHPYVINNISPIHWKIVTRKGSMVTVKNAEDFHISPSRQKAFIDLINVFEDEEEGWED